MGQGPKKWLLDLFPRQIPNDEEVRIMDAVDAVAAITEKDAQWFRKPWPTNAKMQRPGDSVPFGLDVEDAPRLHEQPPNHILHLGAMDWTPNVQGVHLVEGRGLAIWFTAPSG